MYFIFLENQEKKLWKVIICDNLVFLRVILIYWFVFWEKLYIKDNKKLWEIINDILCVFSGVYDEIIDYIFFGYIFFRGIWQVVFNWLNMKIIVVIW